MLQDESALALCRRLVEQKLGWGDSSRWTSSDFETLSETIFAETTVSLSASTLKRIWGKVRYESAPQPATLNALARFAGYAGFRELEMTYKQSVHVLEPQEDASPKSGPKKPQDGKAHVKELIYQNRIFSIGLVAGIVLSLLLAFSLTQNRKNEGIADINQFTFSSRPVAAGLPNSVVFTFDVSAAKTDSLFIQQSWDETKRITIKKDQKQATSIYYYPGFYKAKLIVGDTAVSQHDLLVKTNGWLPLIEQAPVPVYFKPAECIRAGKLGLTSEMLQSRNVNLQPTVPWVSYYFVQDFGALSSNDFTLDTRLKNTYSIGSGACQKTMLIVLCENAVMAVPLAIPGCTSALNAMFAETFLKGTEKDLSAFGTSFTDWAKIRLTVKNKKVEVLINDKPALTTTFASDAGRIVGFFYRFQGTGDVDYLHVSDAEGEKVVSEDFDQKMLLN